MNLFRVMIMYFRALGTATASEILPGGLMSGTARRWPEEARPLVSILIVLFNSSEHIEPCLDSVAALHYKPIELIMVDNGSSDGSARLAGECARGRGLDCVVRELPRNRGFAAANNEAFSLARGEVLLLLNPDTEVYRDMLDELVEALADPQVAVSGCKVYYPDGITLQHTGGYVRDNGLTMHYGVNQADAGQFEEPRDVQYVTGACMAVARDAFARLGALDPGYHPAYFEETDLCLSARRIGMRVVYTPGARVVHHEATTTGKFTERYYYLYHKNRIRFLLKNFSYDFLLNRALPMEQEWLGMITPWEQAVPLNKAYLVNIVNLPRTLLARRRNNRRLKAPYIEDTVSHFE
jgi:GT2 family glycosyltransferase